MAAGENKTVEKNVENISAKGTENIERTKDIESVKTETGVTENKRFLRWKKQLTM